MNFGKMISDRRKELRLTLEQVGTYCGVGKSTVRKWENGMIKNVGREKLKLLGEILQISPADLIEVNEDRAYVQGVVRISEVGMHQVPMIGEVAAGVPIIADQIHSVYIDSPCKADYALTVKGDSMNPTYLDGDIIYIHEQPTLDYDGQVAVIILEDCATVKHVWRKPDGVMLTSDNQSYAPMFYAFSDLNTIRILGKVCGFTRMYKP